MICKVRSTIKKYNLLTGVSSLAVGVSGGADSMCLLEILSKLKDEYGIILKAVHLNHNIRGQEALRDQRVVEEFCQKIGIECLSYSVDIPALAKEMGIGEEECGRIKRYECFNDAGCDAVATAHTLSDSIETMMFNLIRGTGLKGLCGIPAKRDNIIRPLIECTRSEIESYCKDNKIDYVTDSTNLTDDYTRNFIRHNIVSKFSEVNEGFESAIGSAMETLRLENDAMERAKNSLISECKRENGYDRQTLINTDSAIRRRAVADILSSHMNKDVEKRHIDLADEALIKGDGKIEIAKDLYVVVSDNLISVESLKTVAQEWECECVNNMFSTPVGLFHIREVSSAVYNKNAVDADKIKGSLHMSSRKDGDRFYSKSRNNTKTLKKLFNEMKIPAESRNNIAILRDDENLIWIDGIGTDGKYLPDINSNHILIIKKEG
jgi:tRNA(Ile)-lysidine synthase